MRPIEKTAEIMEAAKQYSNGGWQEKGEAIPTVAGLALHLGKSRETLYRWAAEDADFADIMEQVKAWQEMALINGSLSGSLNATISKLLLAKHGYSDKVESAFTPPFQSLCWPSMD